MQLFRLPCSVLTVLPACLSTAFARVAARGRDSVRWMLKPASCLPRRASLRAGLFGWLVAALALAWATGRWMLPAAECGAAGNTIWTTILGGPGSGLVITGSNLFTSAGTVLQAWTSLGFSSTQRWSRDFVTTLPGRPLPLLGAGGTGVVVVATSDGFVQALSLEDGGTRWSRSVRRSACTSDSVTAAPVAQLRELSDNLFKAAVTNDLVFVGTAAGCSSTVANRIYALKADTGNVQWGHNLANTYSYDHFTGLALDYDRNVLYATARKPATSSQATVIALSTLNGARLWARDHGSIEVAPVLANGGLYVVSRSGTVSKLNPVTGEALWQVTVSVGDAEVVQELVADAAFNTLYVVDTRGRLFALLDLCTTVSVMWITDLAGARVSASPAIHSQGHRLYAGSASGRVYQLNALTGAVESFATLQPGAVATDFTCLTRDPLTGAGPENRLVTVSSNVMKYLCIPWQADGREKGLLGGEGAPAADGGLENEFLPVPACDDPHAPPGGLLLAGDLGPVTSFPGEPVTRRISVLNATCYPFRCVNLLGAVLDDSVLPMLVSTNADVASDTNSFLVRPIAGLPMTVSLTVTSAVPGTYRTVLTLSNAGIGHASAVLTNRVLPLPALSIGLVSGRTEVSWSTNAAGFQLQRAPGPGNDADWQTLSGGIVTEGAFHRYRELEGSPGEARFYRLRKPGTGN